MGFLLLILVFFLIAKMPYPSTLKLDYLGRVGDGLHVFSEILKHTIVREKPVKSIKGIYEESMCTDSVS